MVPVIGRAGRGPQDSGESGLNFFNPHPDVDEAYAPLFQLLNNQLLGRTSVNADENEIHILQLFHIGSVDVFSMSKDVPSHF